jgi:chitinase
MDTQNKIVKITHLSITMQPQATNVKVTVSNVVTSSISQVVGTYDITFPKMYMTGDDPQLMTDILAELANVPEPVAPA